MISFQKSVWEKLTKNKAHGTRLPQPLNKREKLNPNLASTVTKLAQLNAGPLQNKEKALTYAKKARELAPADPQVAAFLERLPTKVAISAGLTVFCRKPSASAKTIRQFYMI